LVRRKKTVLVNVYRVFYVWTAQNPAPKKLEQHSLNSRPELRGKQKGFISLSMKPWCIKKRRKTKNKMESAGLPKVKYDGLGRKVRSWEWQGNGSGLFKVHRGTTVSLRRLLA